jgi:hypothetical protein
MAKRGRKKKAKVNWEDQRTCEFCETFHTTKSNRRTATQVGSRTVYTRFCIKLSADVQGSTGACKHFNLAKIIYCQSDNKRVYTLSCAYRYEHKIDDCGKCFAGQLIFELSKKKE